MFILLNAVTSVSFNPVDENFFISGSIDGKVRIWEVLYGKVVDYINMREIVSAVTYQSDGKVGADCDPILMNKYNLIDSFLLGEILHMSISCLVDAGSNCRYHEWQLLFL